jgi:opacity protein-like surface antigen
MAAAVGVYFNGGLAAFGDLETEFQVGWISGKYKEPLGTSYYVGGGLAIPVWSYHGPVSPSLELSTDVGFSSKGKEIEFEELQDYKISFKAVPIMENVIFGVTVGPAKPFIGFGAGIAIVPWEATRISTGAEVDGKTEVKAAFGIPFGCEFRVTPNFAVGARAEYAFITGEVTPEAQSEYVDTLMPDPFLFAGVARIDF